VQPIRDREPGADASDLLGSDELRAWRADPPTAGREAAMAAARRAAVRAGCAGPGQQLGERWPVGCVALEITQRCNLDCTLCYLSEHAEAVHDIPLEAVFRRIDRIREQFGPGTDVQVTGGDPTLRPREELVAIVRRLAARGLRATLMTNGIRADRGLLAELAAAGLHDVAFHVDTTQPRVGHAGEAALDAVREHCIERARGLGLSVIFNTTVHGGNVGDVEHLARFFAAHADVVRTASFQLQADTGRGTERGRPGEVSLDGVWSRIEAGVGSALAHDAIRVGHRRCNRYGMALIAGADSIDAFADRAFVAGLQAASAGLALDRRRPLRTALASLAWLLAHPRWALRGATRAGAMAWRLRGGLLRARGRVRTVSFVVHDFMHACALERERVEACVFKVMTEQGPLSMCVHNARRDEHVLAPIPLADGSRFEPLSGRRVAHVVPVAPPDPAAHGLGRARGRTRRRLIAERAARDGSRRR